MQEQRLGGAVVAIDTFLGSPEHWNRDRTDGIYSSLHMKHGYPHLYWQFLSNLKHHGCDKYVVPLAQTSENAAKILEMHRLRADLVHIDAGHDYEAVLRDARLYWDLLEPGGFLIGDDYHPSWPGVQRAANEFADTLGLRLRIEQPKWLLVKPA